MQCCVRLFLVVSTSAIDCLERIVSKMTYYVSSGTLNPTHSLTLIMFSLFSTLLTRSSPNLFISPKRHLMNFFAICEEKHSVFISVTAVEGHSCVLYRRSKAFKQRLFLLVAFILLMFTLSVAYGIRSTGLLQLMNIFRHVRCCCNNFWNNFRTPSAAEIILFQLQTWLHVKYNTEIIS